MTGQSLGQTRDAIRNNFTNYFDTLSVNHVAPNGAGGFTQGKHTFAEFVVQAQSPATATNEVSEYCRVANGVPQLFLQKQNQIAGAADVQLSRLDYGVLSANDGYTFLPGGTIFQWGTFSAAVGTDTLTWASLGLPNFPTNCWKLYLTIQKGVPFPTTGVIGIVDGSVMTSQFQVFNNLGTNTPINVFAIGN